MGAVGDVGMIIWKRTLRTASSERFLAVRNGKEIAAVDLHYLPRAAAGTLIILEGETPTPDPEELLRSLDDDMLPGLDLDEGSLTFTVVTGRIVGNFESSAEPPAGKGA